MSEVIMKNNWDYSGNPVVGPGYILTGGVVRAVQEMMWAKGHSPGAFDGEYGSNTESAIKAYQASEGLSQDGIVGPATWGALWKSLSFDYNSGNPHLLDGNEFDTYTFTGIYDTVSKTYRTVGFEQEVSEGTGCYLMWGYENFNVEQMQPMDNNLNPSPSEFAAWCY